MGMHAARGRAGLHLYDASDDARCHTHGCDRARAGGGKKNRVTLTAREQSLAKKFGMSNDQYAREKLKAERADSEGDGYVNIA